MVVGGLRGGLEGSWSVPRFWSDMVVHGMLGIAHMQVVGTWVGGCR